MYPVLFTIPIFGGLTIHSYGVMVAAGFIVAMWWVMRESKRLGEDPAKAMDLAFYVILSAIVGSRILHVAVSERHRFLENPLMFFKIWEGGLVFYGGLIASMAVSVWYLRSRKMPLLVTCDIFAPAIAIGHSIGRIGCMLSGCCYGLAVGQTAWYSVTFPANPRCFAPTGVALYPAQLMEVAGELIIFLSLVILRRVKRFDGQLIASYLILYSILRAFDESYRGDLERGFLIDPWLSTSQFISIVMFTLGLLMYVKLWNKGQGVRRGR